MRLRAHTIGLTSEKAGRGFLYVELSWQVQAVPLPKTTSSHTWNSSPTSKLGLYL